MSAPILFRWTGDTMEPVTSYWQRQADEQFVVGLRYHMVEEAERSSATHNHEFAWLEEAWNSLPDHLHEQFPSKEHLRKYALIKTGHNTMKQHPCKSVAEAERLRATLKDEVDEYALVTREDAVVTVYRAKSQARNAMNAKEFQKSKSDILDYIAKLLGVEPETLAKVEQAA